MDDEKLDLSALDLSPRRLEAMVQRTVELSTAPVSAWLALSRLKGAVLGMSVMAALAWVPVLAAGSQEDSASDDPAVALMQYAQSGDVSPLLYLEGR